MSWPIIRLKDCCEVVGGATPKREVEEYWNRNDIPWVTPKDISKISDKYLKDAPEYISQKGYKNCGAKILPTGSLLLTSRAPIGNVAITSTPMCTNQGFKSLVPSRRVDVTYLYYCMLYSAERLNACGNGATFKEVSKKVVEDFSIPLPPLETQKQIAAILEKADQLRKHCQKMEQELNNLAQSVFMELHSNPKKTMMTFNDVASPEKHSFVNGPFGSNLLSSELTDSGVPVIYIRDIASGVYKRKKEVFVTSEKAKELKSCRVDPFDVLITKVGDPPGVAAVYPANEPSAIVTQDVIRIKCDKGKCLPGYLAAYMKSAVGAHSLKSITVEATRSRFGLGDLKKLSIELPSIDIQKSFFDKTEKIDGLMTGAKESKIKLDEQFNSLMQKAFSGELKIKSKAA